MTSKEALEKISWRYINDPTFQEWCNIIKKDLKRLGEVEKENIKLRFENASLNNAIDLDLTAKFLSENIKLKKAIEILKEKTNLKIETNAQNNPFITYDLWGSSAISKKEYELLKEVLENVL